MRLAKLNRTMSHRNAMFRNMVSALIEHEQIKTTVPKAKAISRLAERVITWSKIGSENIFYQRKAESYLMNWVRVRKHLFQNLAKRYENRAGGYTRIHRLGHRTHDHAPLAIIELVDNARDLKRDKVIRTISRELALIELAAQQKAKALESPVSSSSKLKIPTAVWRNVRCKSEEQAKKAIEEIEKLVPDLTKKNLKKVLSERYVNAYKHCQPPQIPTKEEALQEVALAKQIRRQLLRNTLIPTTELSTGLPTTDTHTSSSASTTVGLSSPNPAPKSKVGNLAHVRGIPRPLGAYTDFLYHIRLHFHRNLALLDPTKLGRRVQRGLPGTEPSNSVDQIVSFEEDERDDDIPDGYSSRLQNYQDPRGLRRGSLARTRSWIPQPLAGDRSAARV